MAVQFANGQIPLTVMAAIPAANGQTAYLLPGAADAFNRAAIDALLRYGFVLRATSAGDGFRSYDRQRTVFLQRYRPQASGSGRYGDVRYWNGTRYVRQSGAAAAVPGTSNHGKGITVDITGLGGYGSLVWKRIAAILAAHGFSNAEGRSVGEPWHWNYTRDPGAAPGPGVGDGKPRNADGSLTIHQDGDLGPQTISRWQEVMGTPIDGVISSKSSLIKADQRFLNSVVGAHCSNLAAIAGLSRRGRDRLAVDGIAGKHTDIARQFWLRNAMNPGHQKNLIGGLLGFDGIWGPKSTLVLQFALNNAIARSGRYGQV